MSAPLIVSSLVNLDKLKQDLAENGPSRRYLLFYYGRIGTMVLLVLLFVIMGFGPLVLDANFDAPPARPPADVYTPQDQVYTDLTGRMTEYAQGVVERSARTIAERAGFEAYFYFSEEHPGDLAALYSTVCFDEGHLLVVGVDSGRRCDVYLYAGKDLRTLLTDERLAAIEEKTSRVGRSNDHAQNVASDVRDSLSGLYRDRSFGSVMGILSLLFLVVIGPVIAYVGFTLLIWGMGLPRRKKDALRWMQEHETRGAAGCP